MDYGDPVRAMMLSLMDRLGLDGTPEAMLHEFDGDDCRLPCCRVEGEELGEAGW